MTQSVDHKLINKRLINAMLIAAAAMAASCDYDSGSQVDGLGRIQITATIDGMQPDTEVHLTLSSADGRYSNTWQDISRFSAVEHYYVGDYSAVAYTGTLGAEGFDCPCYEDNAVITVSEGQLTSVVLDCTLYQACVEIERSASADSEYSIGDVTLHSFGNGYVTYTDTETRTGYIMPGETSIDISIADAAGNIATVRPDLRVVTERGGNYKISLDIAGNTLTIKAAGLTEEITVDERLFATAPPSISCEGFVDADPVLITEGLRPDRSMMMRCFSHAGFKSISICTPQSEAHFPDLPEEVDLLSDQAAVQRLGLTITQESPEVICIDFTTMLEMLPVDDDTDVTFKLQVCDNYNRVSEPATLDVRIRNVVFALRSMTAATIGIDRASIVLQMNVDKVEFSDFSIRSDNGDELEILPESYIDADDETVHLVFDVPRGVTDVPIKLYYVDKYKLSATVTRSVPRYQISVDAFATRARITIGGVDDATRQIITRYARITANGTQAAIISREIDEGLIRITGLSPDTRYTIESVVIEDGYAPRLEIHTEQALNVPEGDFEDVRELIKYKHLASGGIYSTTSMPIFSQQNFVDISVWMPHKYWASINAKTFNRKAARHNTWYMQPSAACDFDRFVSGFKSMRISSVGWDLNGDEIEPYAQQDGYQAYSGNVPPVGNISAGRVFLGSYSYDDNNNTDICVEGIAFTSRPSSLNGYYRYIPDLVHVSDRGQVSLELINDTNPAHPILVASAVMQFATSPDFRTFNLPIDYHVFDTPVTKLKIMFVSSEQAGELSRTDASVPVSADLPGGRYIGSELWIDNLTFSY